METRRRSKGNNKSSEIEERLSNFYDLQSENKKTIAVGKLLEGLEDLGIMPLEDPRMKGFVDYMCSKGCKITKEEFIKAADLGSDVLIKAICGTLTIADFPEFKSVLKNVYDICKSDERGKVFHLFRSLPRINPEAWEVSLSTIKGRAAYVETCQEKFTLQSAIKPFIYALAIELMGVDEVMKMVGMNYHYGSTADINSLNEKGIPKNPTINSGGIALCSYIRNVALKNKTKAQVFDYMLQFLRDLAGGKYVGFNNISFMAEKEAMTKNKAMIYYLKQKNCLAKNAGIDDLYFYFATCSFEVNVQSLSLMGATIGNYGTNPLTGKRVLKDETCKHTLAMMQYCTPTPSWLRDVGLPAARGASGAFLLILPRVFALSMYSPKIDDYNCSYKGKNFCKALAYRYSLNMFNVKSLFESASEDKSVKVIKPCQWHCALHTLAATGTAIDIASMLTDEVKPCQTDLFQRNLLHDAATAGNLACVSYCMQTCPHMLEKKDCFGFTPIDDAKFFQHQNIVEYLEKWISLKSGSPPS